MGKEHQSERPCSPRAARHDDMRTSLTVFLTVGERREALRALRTHAKDRRLALLRALAVEPEAPSDA